MQDAEFVIFTEIYQRARVRVGSTGLGGNGQFNRLSALMSLGAAPWTDCLTEDLDMGIRFLAAGWSNVFVPTADVAQQAVTSPRRLVRQRARWFQGHLQCWKRIGMLLRSRMPLRAAVDLLYHLTAPFLLLAMSVPMAAYLVACTWLAVHGQLLPVLLSHHGLPVLTAYLVAFGMTPVFAFSYWLKNPGLRFAKCLAYAHLYALYAYMWIPAGWMAVWRIVTRKRGWAKTARTADAPGGVVTIDLTDAVIAAGGRPVEAVAA
jgi:1,2-diacylglycerol 3-beta-glucosyltransferase